MHKYRSLVAWQCARELALNVLEATDDAYHPRATPVFDQMRRAAVSVEANVVEGYALGTTPQFRKHLRIALASAAEVEVMAELASKRGYLDPAVGSRLGGCADKAIAVILGLWRKSPQKSP
jgi:four helix bundle protein